MPDSAMKALLIMVHGIGEHSGCYDEWAEKFAFQSIGFLSFDLRGHGHSPGIRGHTTVLLIKDDLRTILKSIRDRFPSIPVVLFGHSMGGNIVINCAIDKNVDVQGVIASSPWLKLVRSPLPPIIWVAHQVSFIVPWLTVHTGIRAEQLANEGIGVKSTKRDSLLHKKISIKLFSDLWKSGEMMLRNKHRLNTPLLLMHGTDDPLTSFQASKSFAQNAEGNVTFRKWEGMRHDLLKDANNEVVFQYVIQWLTKQIINNGTIQNNSKLYRVD